MTIKPILDLAKNYGKDPKELEKMYLDAIREQKAKGLEDKVAAQRALRMVDLSLKKETVSVPTDTFNAIIIGAKEGFDGANKDRMKALKQWEDNPNKAIAEGWTNEQGIPLDRKKDFGDPSKPNKNYNRPLLPSMMRPVVLFNLDTKKVCTLVLQHDKQIEMVLPYFKEVEINAIPKQTGDYNSAKSTRIVPKGEGATDFCALIKKNKELKGLLIKLDLLEEWVAQHGNKDVFMVEADVLEIDLEPNRTGSRMLVLDNGQRVFVPESVPINFGEFSRIILVASAKPGKGDYGPTATAMGLYPIPEFLVEPEQTESWGDTPIPKNEEPEDDPFPEGDEPDEADSPGDGPVLGNSDNTPEAGLKVATPMAILRVIILNGGQNVSREELEDQAKDNGFDVSSVISAIDTLVSEGSITEEETGNGLMYTVVE